MEHATRFTHYGLTFVIEAGDWPASDSAATAVIALQSWAMALDADQIATLHQALIREHAALISEFEYDKDSPPLRAVREAQRLAIRAGLQGRRPDGLQPVITLEAVD